MLRTRHHALIIFAEQAIPAASETVVTKVEKRIRENSKDGCPAPWPSNRFEYKQASSGPFHQQRRCGAIVCNNVKGVEVVRIAAILPKQLLSGVALKRCESELSLPVPFQNERIQPVAQAANAIVKKKV